MKEKETMNSRGVVLLFVTLSLYKERIAREMLCFS